MRKIKLTKRQMEKYMIGRYICNYKKLLTHGGVSAYAYDNRFRIMESSLMWFLRNGKSRYSRELKGKYAQYARMNNYDCGYSNDFLRCILSNEEFELNVEVK